MALDQDTMQAYLDLQEENRKRMKNAKMQMALNNVSPEQEYNAANMQNDNNLIAGLLSSANMAGSIGGKVASADPVQGFAKNINNNIASGIQTKQQNRKLAETEANDAARQYQASLTAPAEHEQKIALASQEKAKADQLTAQNDHLASPIDEATKTALNDEYRRAFNKSLPPEMLNSLTYSELDKNSVLNKLAASAVSRDRALAVVTDDNGSKYVRTPNNQLLPMGAYLSSRGFQQVAQNGAPSGQQVATTGDITMPAGGQQNPNNPYPSGTPLHNRQQAKIGMLSEKKNIKDVEEIDKANAGFDKANQNADEMISLSNKAYTGPGQGIGSVVQNMAGVVAPSAVNHDRVRLEQIGSKGLSDFLKQQSGLVVSDKEMDRLKPYWPLMTDSHPVFVDKLQGLKKELVKMRDEKIKGTGRSVVEPSAPPSSPGSSQLNRLDNVLKERGVQ